MSRRNVYLSIAIVAVFAIILAVRSHIVHAADRRATATVTNAATTATTAAPNTAEPGWIAGPGKVEPVSEDIQVGSELSGKLKSVNVEEGDRVRKGQVVAELENADYKAEIASSAAAVNEKSAQLRKVVNGSRTEERGEAAAGVEQEKAVMENSLAERDRREQLYKDGVVSREEVERYRRQYDVAVANYHQASQHSSLVDAHAREEDRSAAEAALSLARADLATSQARYEKTLIRSPIDGIVLRKHHRQGESVSNSSTVPDPIVTIGDTGVLRVRMEVDETDVSRVAVGESAYVTADAFGAKHFNGHVVRVGNELGRKNVQTGEPTEKVDTKVLETLIELDPGSTLPIGLRVDSFVSTAR